MTEPMILISFASTLLSHRRSSSLLGFDLLALLLGNARLQQLGILVLLQLV
jgi:hypothetical protein